MIFADTSALYALLAAQDPSHPAARDAWSSIQARRDTLITSSYVLLETVSLIQRRLGMQAARDFHAAFVPVLMVSWVDSQRHTRAMDALLVVGRRDLSLVDCVSFDVMRVMNVDKAFAFDDHFTQQGFTCIPGAAATS
ncbi:MAG TPA: PIN domain-containing protein [Chloroflexota bacterium]|nr:PIN domain-containing protein [Chloroflexota bacterium]